MAISIRGTPSAWVASNATTQTVTLPTHATGDMLIVRAACRPYTAAITCGTAGWNPVGTGYANGTTANGNGVGSLMFRAFYKIATSSSETSPVITWGTTSAPGAACAVAYQCAAGESFLAAVGAGGGDATARTAHTATISSHISTTAGDMVDFYSAWCDNYAATVPTFTQAGLTLGTVSEQPAAALSDSTSNDIAADGGYRLVSSGTSSAAAVVTGTFGNAEEGGSWTTRLRVGAATQPITLGLIDASGAIYGLTVIPDQLVTLPLVEQVGSGTATKSWTFNSDDEGWAYGGSGTYDGAWSADGSWDGSGALWFGCWGPASNAYAVIGNTGGTHPWTWYGVPSGSTVTRVRTVQISVDCTIDGTPVVPAFGSITLRSPDLATEYTSTPLCTGTDSSYTGNLAVTGWQNVLSSYQASDTNVAFRIGAVASTSADASVGYITLFSVEIEYTGGSATGVFNLVVERLSAGTLRTLTVGLIDGAPAIYGLTLVKAPYPITLGAIESIPAVYGLTLVKAPYPIALGFIDGGPAVYALTVAIGRQYLTLGLIDGGPAVYSITAVKAPYPISIGMIDAGPTVYGLTVVKAPYPITLGLIDAGPAVYDLTVERIGGGATLQSLTLGLVDGAPAVYDLTVAIGRQYLTLGLIDGAPAVYGLTVAIGRQYLTLGLVDSVPSIFDVIVTSRQTVSLGLIDSGSAVYSINASKSVGLHLITGEMKFTGSFSSTNVEMMCLDPSSTYAYVGQQGFGTILKVRLSDLTEVGSVTSLPGNATEIVSDSAGAYIYVVYFSTARVDRVRTSDMTIVGQASLTTSSNATGVVIDHSDVYLYVSSRTTNLVEKVRISDMTVVGTVSASYPEGLCIDSTDTYVYVASFWEAVLKVRLSDLSVVTIAYLTESGKAHYIKKISIDPTDTYVYAACYTSYSILRVRLSDMTLYGGVYLPGYPRAVAIDPSGTYIYIAEDDNSGTGVRIQRVLLSDLSISGVSISALETPPDLTVDSSGSNLYATMVAGAVLNRYNILPDARVFGLGISVGPVSSTLALIDSGAAVFGLSVIPKNTLTIGLVDTAPVVYGLTVVRAPYPIGPDLIDGGAAVFDLSVFGLGGIQYLTLGLVDAGPSIFSVSMSYRQIVLPALIDASPSVFSLTPVKAPYPITLGLIDSGLSVFSLTLVKAPYPVVLGLVDGGKSVFALTVVGGPTGITLLLIDSGSTLFPIIIPGEDIDVVVGLIVSMCEVYEVRLKRKYNLHQQYTRLVFGWTDKTKAREYRRL